MRLKRARRLNDRLPTHSLQQVEVRYRLLPDLKAQHLRAARLLLRSGLERAQMIDIVEVLKANYGPWTVAVGQWC